MRQIGEVVGANLLYAAVSFVWLAAMFVPLEMAFKARKDQGVWRRPGWWTDLCFFVGQYVLFVALLAVVIRWLVAPLGEWSWLGEMHQAFGSWPWPLQVGVVLLTGDVVAYWGHRLQHRVEWLWRFHAVHHSATHVDWLAAHREHPLDGLYTQFMVNAPAILFGFAVSEVMALVVFRGVWAILIHANIRLEMGVLGYLFGSPHFHHWHHARGRDVGNYANLAPWLDVVFGTHHAPRGVEPEEMGLDGEDEERLRGGYLSLLVKPFLPYKTKT